MAETSPRLAAAKPVRSQAPDTRVYPDRPFLAVSAAIFRQGKVLVVRRARAPAAGVYTLPGGVVELGETLVEAVVREVREETSMTIEPIAIAGCRDVVVRDGEGGIQRHFVILPFAARWLAGEFAPNVELAEGVWISPSDVGSLRTTDGLAGVVAAAFRLARSGGTAVPAP